MKKLIISSVLILSAASAMAVDTVTIQTQTNDWKTVPITVDDTTHTYTVVNGTVIPEGNYYYTYSGYRCVKNKISEITVDPVTLQDKNDMKTTIYCYPEQ